MTRRVLAVVFSLWSSAMIAQSPSAQLEDQSARYSLTVASRQAAGAKAGSRISIEIVQRNISKEPIQVAEATKYESEAASWFKIYLRDQKGNLVPETKFGRRARTGKDDPGESTVIVGSAAARTLQPGGSVSHTVVLNRLYNVTRPGTYSVEVEGTDDQGRIAKSNVLTLMVTP